MYKGFFRKIEELDDSLFFKYYLRIFCIAAVLIPLLYCLYTNHIWEDFFITFRHSENLCEGNGLVYQPGEKVHGFTSPLGALLPALCHLLTFRTSYSYAIWLFRFLFCIPAFVGGGIILLKVFKDNNTNKSAVFFIGLLYLLESKSIVFSVNGMETALMLFFLALSFYVIWKNPVENWILLGVAWAGLMWTRPDSFVYIAAMGVSSVFFSVIPLKTLIKAFFKAAAVTTVLYLPWLVWAYLYYGTPVPHTVIAKSALDSWSSLSEVVVNSASRMPERISWIFAPIYPHFDYWPQAIRIFGYFTGIFCAVYWLFPLEDRLGKTASFSFFCLCLYLSFIPFPYPWYFPPVAMLGLIVIVSGFFRIAAMAKKQSPTTTICLLSLTAFFMFLTFTLTAYQMKLQQVLIETGTRRKIGEWLKNNKNADDRIYLECLGYIGYFSEGKMLDYPGLVSPEVTKLIREKDLNRYTLLPELKPEWAVLRSGEYMNMRRLPYFRNNYQLVKIFDANDEINLYPYIPGEMYLLYDSIFCVVRKKERK